MVAPIIIAAIISAATAAGATAAGWNRNKPKPRTVDTTRSDALRKQQLDLLGEYTRSAKGQSTSWADLQMQKLLTQANAAQSAQAASSRGGNLALAQRTAANVAGSNVSKIAAETASARLREQDQNRFLAANLSGQIRASDIGIENENLRQKNLFDNAVAARKAANRQLLANMIGIMGKGAGAMATMLPNNAATAGANDAARQQEYNAAYDQAMAGSQYAAARADQGGTAVGSTVILGSGGGNNPYSAGYANPPPSQTYNPYDYGSNTNTGSPYQQFQPQSGYRR